MDAVQRKRAQAQQTGNLKSSPQMTVDTKKADNGQPYVEIKPANPQVVYVPQYNPVTIYNTPAPATVVVTQPAPQVQSGVSTGTAVAIGLLSFGVGMAVGSAINRNNYYPYPAWGYGGVYYGGRPYYPPPYRPVYPGYRPSLWIPPSAELPLEPVQPQRQRDCEQQLLQQVQQQHRHTTEMNNVNNSQREQSSTFGRRQSSWRPAELERSIHLSGGSPEQCEPKARCVDGQRESGESTKCR